MKTVQIHNKTYLRIFLHELDVSMDEVISEVDDCSKTPFLDFKQSAKDLFDSFEDHDCVALWEAIHLEAAKRIIEHWETGAIQQLKEPRYSKYLDRIKEDETPT